MIIIKLTTPWPHDYLKRTPSGKGVFGKYVFEIDNDCKECDYWVVWGGLKERTKVKCPPDNIIYITDEAHDKRFFNNDFLQQFFSVISCREDLIHQNLVKTHDLGIWHFDRSYDEVKNINPFPKNKLISAVSSDRTWLSGHKKRFAFINKLIGHYKSEIEFYGRGINHIENKFDAIAPFKYSIAIENSNISNYFTEKVFECFLTYTLPVYFGCPNLEDFFDERAFVRIDIDNFQQAINIIDDVIREDVYKQRLPYLIEAKEIYLNKYYFFPALINIIQNEFPACRCNKRINSLYPEEYYETSNLRRGYNFLKKVIS